MTARKSQADILCEMRKGDDAVGETTCWLIWVELPGKIVLLLEIWHFWLLFKDEEPVFV